VVSYKRFRATVRCDVRLQFRQGFYYAAAVVATVSLVGISRLPSLESDIDWVVPAIIVSNLTLGTFYFIGALVLLERGEGTLQALVVTPLRDVEYLASKVVTLTALSIVENMLIAAAFYGQRPGAGYVGMLLGITLASALLVLTGFVAVAAYDSINEYLAPSVLYAALATAPVFTWLLRWDQWFMYVHPIQAPLVLMQAVDQPLEPWQLVYGVSYPILWTGLLAFWSRRTFQRFVVAPAGAL
jgi:fluoroquinolone transport system permease protein